MFTQVQFCNAIEDQGLEDTNQIITVKSIAIQKEETGTMEEAYSKFINQEHVLPDKEEVIIPEEQKNSNDQRPRMEALDLNGGKNE